MKPLLYPFCLSRVDDKLDKVDFMENDDLSEMSSKVMNLENRDF